MSSSITIGVELDTRPAMAQLNELREAIEGATHGQDFGFAIRALKGRKRVARAGWNGKGMWLVLIRPGHAMPSLFEGEQPMSPCIGMKTAGGDMQPGWLASQADMLAEDWMVVS